MGLWQYTSERLAQVLSVPYPFMKAQGCLATDGEASPKPKHDAELRTVPNGKTAGKTD